MQENIRWCPSVLGHKELQAKPSAHVLTKHQGWRKGEFESTFLSIGRHVALKIKVAASVHRSRICRHPGWAYTTNQGRQLPASSFLNQLFAKAPPLQLKLLHTEYCKIIQTSWPTINSQLFESGKLDESSKSKTLSARTHLEAPGPACSFLKPLWGDKPANTGTIARSQAWATSPFMASNLKAGSIARTEKL